MKKGISLKQALVTISVIVVIMSLLTACSSPNSISPTPSLTFYITRTPDNYPVLPPISETINIPEMIQQSSLPDSTNILFLLDESDSMESAVDDSQQNEINRKRHSLPVQIVQLFSQMFPQIQSGLFSPEIGIILFGVGDTLSTSAQISSQNGIFTLLNLQEPKTSMESGDWINMLKTDSSISNGRIRHYFLDALREAEKILPAEESNIVVIVSDGELEEDDESWAEIKAQFKLMRNGQKKIQIFLYLVDEKRDTKSDIFDLDKNPEEFEDDTFEIFFEDNDDFLRNFFNSEKIIEILPEKHGWIDPKNRIKSFDLEAYQSAEIEAYDFTSEFELKPGLFKYSSNNAQLGNLIPVANTCSNPETREIEIQNLFSSSGYGLYWARINNPVFKNPNLTRESSINNHEIGVSATIILDNSTEIDIEDIRCVVFFTLDTGENVENFIREPGCSSGKLDAACVEGNKLSAHWKIQLRTDNPVGKQTPFTVVVTLPGSLPQKSEHNIDIYGFPELNLDNITPEEEDGQIKTKITFAYTNTPPDYIYLLSPLDENGLREAGTGHDTSCPKENHPYYCKKESADGSPINCVILPDEDANQSVITINIKPYVKDECQFNSWIFVFSEKPKELMLPVNIICGSNITQ